VASGFKADCVDAAVDLGNADDLGYLISRVAAGNVDSFAAETARLGEAFWNEISDDDDRGA
jgi:hypothetical protein